MNCDTFLIQEVMKSMEQQFYCSHSMLLAKHQSISGLYIVQKGSVQVISYHQGEDLTHSHHSKTKLIHANHYFGEFSLLSEDSPLIYEVYQSYIYVFL